LLINQVDQKLANNSQVDKYHFEKKHDNQLKDHKDRHVKDQTPDVNAAKLLVSNDSDQDND
jgi:hypothetical protein